MSISRKLAKKTIVESIPKYRQEQVTASGRHTKPPASKYHNHELEVIKTNPAAVGGGFDRFQKGKVFPKVSSQKTSSSSEKTETLSSPSAPYRKAFRELDDFETPSKVKVTETDKEGKATKAETNTARKRPLVCGFDFAIETNEASINFEFWHTQKEKIKPPKISDEKTMARKRQKLEQPKSAHLTLETTLTKQEAEKRNKNPRDHHPISATEIAVLSDVTNVQEQWDFSHFFPYARGDRHGVSSLGDKKKEVPAPSRYNSHHMLADRAIKKIAQEYNEVDVKDDITLMRDKKRQPINAAQKEDIALTIPNGKKVRFGFDVEKSSVTPAGALFRFTGKAIDIGLSSPEKETKLDSRKIRSRNSNL